MNITDRQTPHDSTSRAYACTTFDHILLLQFHDDITNGSTVIVLINYTRGHYRKQPTSLCRLSAVYQKVAS